jgi:diacylglycerol kinase (ATP)
VRVGLIGRGTGGDFGRSLDLDHRLDAYLSALASGRERPGDLLRADFTDDEGRPARRYVINVLSAGPGGLVDRYVAGLPRALGGRAAYLLASLRALAVCPRARLLMRTTDAAGVAAERELSAYLVCVCNGRVFGGGMRVAPMADPGDGLLEVVIAATETKWDLVRALPRVYAGTHLGVPGVEHLTATRIALELLDGEAAGRFLLDVDGEPLGRLPVTLEVVPGALTMLG